MERRSRVRAEGCDYRTGGNIQRNKKTQNSNFIWEQEKIDNELSFKLQLC